MPSGRAAEQKALNSDGEEALVLTRASEEEVRAWEAARTERRRDTILTAAGARRPSPLARSVSSVFCKAFARVQVVQQLGATLVLAASRGQGFRICCASSG